MWWFVYLLSYSYDKSVFFSYSRSPLFYLFFSSLRLSVCLLGLKVRSRDPGVMIVIWLYLSVSLYCFVTLFRNVCTELNYYWASALGRTLSAGRHGWIFQISHSVNTMNTSSALAFPIWPTHHPAFPPIRIVEFEKLRPSYSLSFERQNFDILKINIVSQSA